MSSPSDGEVGFEPIRLVSDYRRRMNPPLGRCDSDAHDEIQSLGGYHYLTPQRPAFLSLFFMAVSDTPSKRDTATQEVSVIICNRLSGVGHSNLCLCLAFSMPAHLRHLKLCILIVALQSIQNFCSDMCFFHVQPFKARPAKFSVCE